MKKIFYLVLIIVLNSKSIAFENELKIIFKVNDTIITNYDIEKEANYLKSLNKSIETFDQKKIIETAQNSLIREKIKKEEIDKLYDVNYENALNSKDLELVLKNFRISLGFNTDEEFENYLLDNKIDIFDLKIKFIIEQTWNKLIVDKFLNLIKVDQKEIEKKVDFFMKNNSEQLTFNLSEIIFLEKDKAAIDKKYNEIISSIKSIGFNDTAVIYSLSESAKLGGGIGWVNQNQISKKIFLAIKDLKIGEFSEPIITAGGIILLNVNAKKNVDTEINKEEEMKRLISFEQNRILNEYSMIYYKEIENKAYVEKF